MVLSLFSKHRSCFLFMGIEEEMLSFCWKEHKDVFSYSAHTLHTATKQSVIISWLSLTHAYDYF